MGNARKSGKMFRIGVLLAVSAVAVSAYSSGFASGSSYASGFTSGAASSFTSGGGGAAVQHYVEATISLAGITAAQFGTTEQTAFKEVVAAGLTVCGAGGNAACSKTDIVIVSFSRRASVSVKFRVNVASASVATAAATTLAATVSPANAAAFVTALKAKGGNLASITGVTVVSAPAAGSGPVPSPTPSPVPASISGVGNTAVVSFIGALAVLTACSRQ